MHKFNNTPSLGWLCGHLHKYFNQRARFIVSPDWFRTSKFNFEEGKPIGCNAIFSGIFKKCPHDPSRYPFGRCPTSHTILYFQFRDALFCQEGKKEQLFLTRTRRQNKKSHILFRTDEITWLAGRLTNQRSFKLEEGQPIGLPFVSPSIPQAVENQKPPTLPASHFKIDCDE